MNTFDKKNSFFDIDGTLTYYNGNQIIMPESTKFGLKKLRKNGHLAIVCSGRPIKYILQNFNDMFDGYIAANGTYILFEDKCIYNRLIKEELLKKLMGFFLELGIGCNFSGVDNGYAYNKDKQKIDEINLLFNNGPYLIEKWDVENVIANVFDIFYKDEAQLYKCINYFKDSFIFNLHGPQHMSADISFINWNKSHGIKFFMDYIGMKLEDSFAFGDGHNDIDMIKTVGIGIAMGNAIIELKKHSTFITDNVLEGGIYNALVKYGLI